MQDLRKQTKRLVKEVRERDLVFEFFFVFSRFEYALLKTKYVLQRRGAFLQTGTDLLRSMTSFSILILRNYRKRLLISKCILRRSTFSMTPDR